MIGDDARMSEPEIRAAGGVVLDADGRVAIVHRPRHDDWSLPKGKLDPGEDWEAAALREVLEECGLRCALGAELPPTDYTRRRARQARALVADDGGGGPGPGARDGEVDELRWLAPDEAIALLSYPADAALVAAALA